MSALYLFIALALVSCGLFIASAYLLGGLPMALLVAGLGCGFAARFIKGGLTDG